MSSQRSQENLVGRPRPCLDLAILIPFYNEESELESCLSALGEAFGQMPEGEMFRVQVYLLNSGSRDGSRNIAQSWASKLRGWYLVDLGFCGSFSVTLSRGLEEVESSWVWVLPADCNVHPQSLNWIVHQLHKGSVKGLAFLKVYGRDAEFASYAWALSLLLKLGGVAVWTNTPVVRQRLLRGVLESSEGFLDDLHLSKKQSREGGWTCSEFRTQVSPRRYVQVGFCKQVFRNARVLWGFYVRGASAEELLKIYERK